MNRQLYTDAGACDKTAGTLPAQAGRRSVIRIISATLCRATWRAGNFTARTASQRARGAAGTGPPVPHPSAP
ncbi:hypothetical protein CBM2637_A200348 [Cupriavidus taiwanensis]|nr:hypothetical protein CBM2637_A200348 [Cupriavidus taiwanensis]